MATEIPLSIKYRPHKLSEVIGQPVVVKAFSNAFKYKTLHHAYILAGKFGTGKTTVARIVAAMENCVKGPTQEPCGECKNCKEIFAGTSFDIREMDGASNRGIDDIRQLKKEVYQSPLECRTKYIIIDEAHSLSREGAEAALKIIEEPPEKVRFILATTEPHKIKETIHSRCIMWKFNKVGWAELYTHLKNIAGKEGLEYDDDALKICAKASKGSVRNALVNLQTIMNYVGEDRITTQSVKESLGAIDEKLYFDLMDSISQGDAAKALYYINYLLMDGKEVGLIINGINNHVCHLLKARILKKDLSQFSFSEEESKRYCEQSDAMASGKALLSMMRHLREISFGINYNLDPQSELEEFAISAIQEVKTAKARASV
jgi:DNA polymerase-3 subunit gamma/tau